MTGTKPRKMEDGLMDANERRTRASREAADWWALLQADEMTKTEREDFIDWLRDSQTNIAEMLRLYQVHGALEQFREWADISTEGPPTEEHGNVVTLPAGLSPPRDDADGAGKGGRSIRLFAFAATLAAVVLVTAVLLPHFRGQWIMTDRGERREVVLDDGSILQVDPQTRLNVRFTESQRRVVLSQGRAVFRVARNPQRPFRVEAGDTTVRAVGTAFGVDRRVQDRVIVTVSEGRVAVSATNIRLKPHAVSSVPSSPFNGEEVAVRPHQVLEREAAKRQGNGDSPPEPGSANRHPKPFSLKGGEGGAERRMRSDPGEVYLTANEQITVAMTGAPQPVKAVDSQRELAWAEGRLVFKDDTVASVIAEFNRYNRVQLTVTDPALATRPVTGVFDAANPEGFLAFLQNAAPVRIERDDGRSIVISSGASH